MAMIDHVNDAYGRMKRLVEAQRQLEAEARNITDSVTELGMVAWINDPNNAATIAAEFSGEIADAAVALEFVQRYQTWYRTSTVGGANQPFKLAAKVPRF